MSETPVNWQPEQLEDGIVKIVPLQVSDFDNLYQVASDPLIWEQHPSIDRYKKEVFTLYFDEAIASQTAFSIRDKTSNEIIGCTRYYDYNKERSAIAIGYTFLSRRYWGGNYNKSCKTLLLDYAFPFVDQVYFQIASTNIRSQLAICKMGAIKVGAVDLDHNGQQLLHYEYLIRKRDWKNRQ